MTTGRVSLLDAVTRVYPPTERGLLLAESSGLGLWVLGAVLLTIVGCCWVSGWAS